MDWLKKRLFLTDGTPHAFCTSSVLLTRSRFLPHIGATEGYAYGEQIGVGVMSYDGDPTNPEDWYYLDWVKDEAMVHGTTWTVIDGYKVLRIESEAGGADGAMLTYYVFAVNTVHTVSLYPFENSPHIPVFEKFVKDYIRDI